MVRKRLIIILCLFLAVPSKDSLLVMFWNIENYFDWKDDAPGIRNWTRRKFQRKSLAIAKTVLWISDEEGRLPDVVGLAEVENRFVLERLLRDTPLHRAGYGIVHYDSPDPRGIDVALLYRKETLKILESKPLRVGGEEFRTRDILMAKFLREGGDSLVFLVNHHPSKYGGSTGERRQAALYRLKDVTDSLLAEGNKDIVAMGDFNDTPESTKGYSTIMVNLALPLAKRGGGTIKYSGKWELIDMFFISQMLAFRNPGAAMKVVKAPFLTVKDNAHSGEKPLRTYTGPGYAGGVSDHCPITLVIQ